MGPIQRGCFRRLFSPKEAVKGDMCAETVIPWSVAWSGLSVSISWWKLDDSVRTVISSPRSSKVLVWRSCLGGGEAR